MLKTLSLSILTAAALAACSSTPVDAPQAPVTSAQPVLQTQGGERRSGEDREREGLQHERFLAVGVGKKAAGLFRFIHSVAWFGRGFAR